MKYTPEERDIQDIGPIGNRTLGLKTIFWFDEQGTHVQGWVDKEGNGIWERSYSAINPCGEKHGDKLPIIDRPLDRTWNDPHGLFWDESGDPCQEVRFRCDNYWPIKLDEERSFIVERAVQLIRNKCFVL